MQHSYLRYFFLELSLVANVLRCARCWTTRCRLVRAFWLDVADPTLSATFLPFLSTLPLALEGLLPLQPDRFALFYSCEQLRMIFRMTLFAIIRSLLIGLNWPAHTYIMLPRFTIVTGDKVSAFDVVFVVTTHTSYNVVFFLVLSFISLFRDFSLASGLALLGCWVSLQVFVLAFGRATRTTRFVTYVESVSVMFIEPSETRPVAPGVSRQVRMDCDIMLTSHVVRLVLDCRRAHNDTCQTRRRF